MKVGWLVSMPIAMEPQRQANGNLINVLGLCEAMGRYLYDVCNIFGFFLDPLELIHSTDSRNLTILVVNAF